MRITRITPVYYINLDDSQKRRNNIVETLTRLGFTNINRISAINTRTIQKVNNYKNLIEPFHYKTLLEDNKLGKRHFFGALTNGSVGCYLSHLEAYKQIIANNNENALIFEDDAIIDIPTDIFWDRINKLYIPGDTDIYLLDGTYYDKITHINKNTYKIFRFTGLYSYLITNKSAQKLLTYLSPIKYQIDFDISILISAGLQKVYGYKGPSITHHDYGIFDTTIQNLNCKSCYMPNLQQEALNKSKIIEPFGNVIQYQNVEVILSIIILIMLLAIFFFYKLFN